MIGIAPHDDGRLLSRTPLTLNCYHRLLTTESYTLILVVDLDPTPRRSINIEGSNNLRVTYHEVERCLEDAALRGPQETSLSSSRA